MDADLREEFRRINEALHDITKPDGGSLSKMYEELSKIRGNCTDICAKKFVDMHQFTPVRLIAYGFVALFFSALAGGVVTLVWRKIFP